MRNRRGVISLIILLVIGLGLSYLTLKEKSSTDSNKKIIEIYMYVGRSNLDFFNEIAREYEILDPSVEIRLFGDPNIDQNMRMKVIENNFPQAAFSKLPWPKLIRSGKTLELNPYLDGPNWEESEIWKNTFRPESLNRWTVDDRIYAIPFDHHAIVFFYNKKLFEQNKWEVPESWEEFFKLSQKIKKSEIAPLAFPGRDRWSANYILRAAYYSLSGKEKYTRFLNCEESSFDQPYLEQAGTLLQKIAQNSFMQGWQGIGHMEAYQQFFNGNAAMLISGTWIFNEMKGKIPEDFDLGVFNFPTFPEGKGKKTAIQVSNDYYFFFANSPNQSETIDFFRFLTSKKISSRYTKKFDYPTVIFDAEEDTYSKNLKPIINLIANAEETYASSSGANLEISGMNQPHIDERNLLMEEIITPKEYSLNLRAALQKIKKEIEISSHKQTNRKAFSWSLGVLFGGTIAITMGIKINRRHKKKTKKNLSLLSLRKKQKIYLLILPSLLFYFLFLILPALITGTWSLYSWDGITEKTWIGISNYTKLLIKNPAFWFAVKNSFIIFAVATVIILPIAIGIAGIIYHFKIKNKILRMAIILPNIIGATTGSIIWLNLFNPHSGLLNTLLKQGGNTANTIGLNKTSTYLHKAANFPWLSQENLILALIPITVWLYLGFNILLFLSAMKTIPKNIYEMAKIDGIPPLTTFIKITIPKIKNIIFLAIALLGIGCLNIFEMAWILSSHQIQSTSHTLTTLMHSILTQDFEIGLASALGVLIFFITSFVIAIILYLNFKNEKKSES